ncbi:uncharacterized protein [Physcomitrium patens]|uniref:Uncharacterized protein n=1 Tax=Physcomitrium patens TaxID=3218 RepID=A0A2K1J4L5_PHYPA|nr:hypothetical protein PHYPA_022317 [Physcomitrium patens]
MVMSPIQETKMRQRVRVLLLIKTPQRRLPDFLLSVNLKHVKQTSLDISFLLNILEEAGCIGPGDLWQLWNNLQFNLAYWTCSLMWSLPPSHAPTSEVLPCTTIESIHTSSRLVLACYHAVVSEPILGLQLGILLLSRNLFVVLALHA